MPENGDKPRHTQVEPLTSLRDRLRELSETPPSAARSAAGELRVVKISSAPLELWVVIGRESDYLVIKRTYCSCPHFVIRVVNGETDVPCYHLVAVEIASRTNRFHDLSISLDRDEVLDIVLEILAGARSVTLRRKLYMLMKKEEE